MADDALEVRGGAGSVVVETEWLRHRATVLGGVGIELLTLAPQVAGLGRDPALATAGLLDPVGAARLHARIVGAVAGRDGLLAGSAEVAALVTAMQAAAVAYEVADASVRDVVDAAWFRLAAPSLAMAARALGPGTGLLLLPVVSGAGVAAVVGVTAWVTYRAGPLVVVSAAEAAGDAARGELDLDDVDDRAAAVGGGLTEVLREDLTGAALAGATWTARHPWLAEQLLATPPGDPADAAGWLLLAALAGGAVREGPVRVRPVTATAPVAGPRGVADLFARMAPATGSYVGPPELAGVPTAHTPRRVRVERTGPVAGGRGAWTVYVPPTQSWSTRGGRNPFDGTSNLVGFAGRRADAGDAVLEVLRAAKVPPGEPVMLVGYSQGGITAAQLAADAAVRQEFDVRAVLTVGSPIALVEVPAQVQVLSIQHEQDVVTMLDGAQNPSTGSWTTVSRDLLAGTQEDAVHAALGDDPFRPHRYEGYAQTTRRVDAAAHPSLDAWRLAVAPFLGRPGTVTTATQWEVTRRS